ncbi:MAG: HNH endonuclease [Acidimicrobiia bacterium]|nr:HNH endonuclease [Acidimicrobiia bacterium]
MTAASGAGGTGSAADGGVAFAQKLLTLLDEGSFSTSYKYALLLALIDCCTEYAGADGLAPTSVTTRQLATKVLELYWQQSVPFEADALLRQSGSGQAEIVTLVSRYRSGRRLDPLAPLGRCRADNPDGVGRLTAEIEWKLVEMPLPRLQRFGGRHDEFIYRIGWDETVRRSHWRDAATFPNIVLFVDGAAENLLRFAPLLRPLIKRQWAAMVAKCNRLATYELEAFLFGQERVDLTPVRGPLRDLQDGECFYCADRLTGAVDVDHFLPWARYPDNGMHNLVAAHRRCNNSKRDFLAAAAHVARWAGRLSPTSTAGGDLGAIARDLRWESHPQRTLATARALYLRLPPDAKLWNAPKDFVDADLRALAAALH